MNSDLIDPAARSMADTHRLLTTATEESREGWDDNARRLLDRRHCDSIISESRLAVNAINDGARDLARALRLLES